MTFTGHEWDHPEEEGTRRALRRLFNRAAAMSIAVHDMLDAEREMEEFLLEVKAHPEERNFVARLFLDSFSDSFFLRKAPTDLLMYCMSELRWSEIMDFAKRKRAEDIEQHRGIPCYAIWQAILESFDDGWRDKYFRDFTVDPPGPPTPLSSSSN